MLDSIKDRQLGCREACIPESADQQMPLWRTHPKFPAEHCEAGQAWVRTRCEGSAVGAELNAGDDVLVHAHALQQAALLRTVAADAVVPVPAAGYHLQTKELSVISSRSIHT